MKTKETFYPVFPSFHDEERLAYGYGIAAIFEGELVGFDKIYLDYPNWVREGSREGEAARQAFLEWSETEDAKWRVERMQRKYPDAEIIFGFLEHRWINRL